MNLDICSNCKDIAFAYRCTLSIVSIGTFIVGLEDLKGLSVFDTKGILSWQVSKLGARWFTKSFLSKPLDFLFSERVYQNSIYLRIILSITIFALSLLNATAPPLILLLLLASTLPALRSPYGLNGAYQMNLIVLLGVSIGSVSGVDTLLAQICLWFIASELVLAYFISGITKLGSLMWRKSIALQSIFSTRCFGHPLIYRLFIHNAAATSLLSWSVFAFEMLFFTVIFLPPPFATLFIIAGFLFHLSNALLMGLNDFWFAFTSAYPSVLYCMHHVRLSLEN